MADLKDKINLNTKAGRKTLTVVYYVGHGMMLNNHNQSYIVLPDLTNPVFPLEAAIRSLSKIDNSFVIGIFDCQREVFKPQMLQGSLNVREGEENKVDLDTGDNIILIFGCAINIEVPNL